MLFRSVIEHARENGDHFAVFCPIKCSFIGKWIFNLTKFVKKPFTDEATFDWAEYREVVAIFTRMLDNVVEINGLPLQQQRDEIVRKRRHGMGYLGLGSALTMMKMKYGEEDSLKFTDEVTRMMAEVGWEVGVQLADEKGAAPIMDEKFEVTADMLAKRPEMAADGIKVGQKLADRKSVV